jgi:pyruvate,water dikinase
MLPFVRTPREVAACRRRIAQAGLLDDSPIELWIMAEVPSVLAYLERYAELGVQGVSIGSNDLTQLVLGVDRDSELLAVRYDERDEAVTWFVDSIVRTARSLGMATSICGQAPSVHAEYLDVLVRAGIDSISVNVDVLERSRLLIGRAEQRLILEAARDRVGLGALQDPARART